MKQTFYEKRLQALALLQAGHEVNAVAEQLNCTPQWVRKVRRRYQQDGYQGLADQSRAPKQPGNQLPTAVRETIILARIKLEAQAQSGEGLKHIGSYAIRTYLDQQQVKPLPGVATIERVLREAKMTRPKKKVIKPDVHYPRLHPSEPHQLIQVDIVPHFLQGGKRVACFNGIDVVSRYATGQALPQRRSQDAMSFLVHLWQTVGIPQYTQVDNEGCFSGGTTHPYVLGSVLRLALHVGTELVFSPAYHPASNGTVERFHQEYNSHVWEDTYLADCTVVNQQANRFFSLYNQSGHHSALKGATPTAVHLASQPQVLASDFSLGSGKLPLTEGKVHFMRRVQANGTVRVLNVDWAVPAPPDKGAWVTLSVDTEAALLSVYDAAPDAPTRTCLATYPFPLKEKVAPRQTTQEVTQEVTLENTNPPIAEERPSRSPSQTKWPDPTLVESFFRKAVHLAQASLARAFFRTDQLVE
jgi:putative transposase